MTRLWLCCALACAVFLLALTLFAMPTTRAATSGPILAYGFGENSGATTADASGNNLTGTIRSATWSSVGKYGSALSFNGSSSYLDLGRPPLFTSSTSSMTWEAWVNPSAVPADDGEIIAFADSTTGWELKTTPDAGPRTFAVGVSGPNATWAERTSATVLTLNTWYHVAGVYNPTTSSLDIYVNGVLDNSTLFGSVPSSQLLPSVNVNVGQRTGGSGYHFIGTLDEIRVYNRALSLAEIQADMNTPIGLPDTQPPTAPTNLAVAVGPGAQLDLSWTAATDDVVVASYAVERCSGAGCTTFTHVATTVETTFTDLCLPLDSSYTYRVRAIDTSGNLGPYSGEVVGSTPAATSVGTTGNLTANATGVHQVQLTWTASGSTNPIASYAVARCTGFSCSNFVTTGTASSPGYTDNSVASLTSYSYRVQATDSAGNISACSDVASATTQGPAFPLAASANGRYLVDQNGQPTFLTGDAAWSLIAQLISSDADTYLANRQQKGFNAVLVSLIEHKFATKAPSNISGDPPFTSSPFATPNETYFVHADTVIRDAAQKGIVVLLDPLYLGYQCGSEGWCGEVQAASSSDMQSWGTYVGNRYKSFDNLVWVIGGDTDPSVVSSQVSTFVGALRQADPRHLITAHNAVGEMAVTPWPAVNWLSLNSTYARFDNGQTYQLAQTAYGGAPVLPFIQIEGYYEYGYTMTTQQIRTQAYWTALSGGNGSMYGNCFVWGLGSPGSSTNCQSTSNASWRANLDSPGASGVSLLGSLFQLVAWQNLLPDWNHTVLTGGYGTFGAMDYAPVASAADGTLMVAYLPSPRSVTVDLSRMRGPTTARWYDPATGGFTLVAGSPLPNNGAYGFTPVSSNGAGDTDWVLVLQAAP